MVLFRWLSASLFGLLVASAAIWGALALWFASPASDIVRALLALGLVTLALACPITAFLTRRFVVPLLLFGIAFAALLAWWTTIEARNDRAWQNDVSVLPSARIDGDIITLRV